MRFLGEVPMTAAGPPMIPVPIPFEVKGGSPTLIEVSLEGVHYELRLVPSVLSVSHLPGATNPADPSLPVFQFQAQIAVLTTRVPTP